MIYKPGRLKERSRELMHARSWGIGLATALFGLATLLTEFRRIASLQFIDPMEYAYFAVLLLTGVLVFLWIWATQKELDLLIDWLDPERWIPPTTFKETCLILLISVSLTVLFFAARDPLAYGLAFTFYSAILIACTTHMNKEIRIALDMSRKRLLYEKEVQAGAPAINDLYLTGMDILDGYFLKRPAVMRLKFILLASVLSTAFAIIWRATNEEIYGLSAYTGFLITILVSEGVIAYWRVVRDDNLRPVQQEILEYDRGNENKPLVASR